MSLLASLVFVLTVVGMTAALRATILQFGNAAIANIVALEDCSVSREFRVAAVSIVTRPVVNAEVRRIASRGSVRRIKLPGRLRAAA
jgi:hypothetical protein